eukprot:7240116-Alexandrium_andersonii.AAC.1
MGDVVLHLEKHPGRREPLAVRAQELGCPDAEHVTQGLLLALGHRNTAQPPIVGRRGGPRVA